ncbi:SRPBCC family protein [Streptomyces sp. NPDC056480]|uniref:SRPBCC family protein n=1 Tax=Streptomyces sp. NPDC056480 TaxID=3345833 RepID=UPI00369BE41A
MEKQTTHRIEVAASEQEVYQAIADVARWPEIFPNVVHATRLEGDEYRERIRLWVSDQFGTRTWTSRRLLTPATGRIEFHKDTDEHTGAGSMRGVWLVGKTHGNHTPLSMTLMRATEGADEDHATPHELMELKAYLEVAPHAGDLRVEIEDTIEVDGPPQEGYAFLYQARLWQERLPHVADVRVDDCGPGLQELAMTTMAPDGSQHFTRSIRVCLPESAQIIYKQTVLPSLLAMHLGRWCVTPGNGSFKVSSQHTATVNASQVARVLGPAAQISTAVDVIANALHTNSRATLRHLKGCVEGAPAAADGHG